MLEFFFFNPLPSHNVRGYALANENGMTTTYGWA